MALEKLTKQDKLEIVDCGDWKTIRVRTATVVTDDSVELSRTFHRHVVEPNSDLTDESDEVKKLAEIYFTEEAKEKHRAFVDANTGGPFGN